VGMAFYVRVFVEVWDDKAGVNKLSLNMGTVYQSVQCPSFHIIPHGQHPSNGNTNIIQNTRAPLIPVCNETGGAFKTAGPIWIAPMHDLDVVAEAIKVLEPTTLSASATTTTKHEVSTTPNTTNNNNNKTKTKTPILATQKNLHGLLTILSEELPDEPLYYTLPDLCHTLGCTMPPMDKIRCALTNAGYRVSIYHKEPDAIKTDAPNEVLWDVLRAWCKEHPPKKNGGSGGKGRRSKRMRREKRIGRGKGEDGGEGSPNESSLPSEESSSATDDATCTPKITISEKILAIEPKTEVNFAMPVGGLKDKSGKRNKSNNRVVRFPMNPEANWGPKPRASGYSKSDRHEQDPTKKRKVDSLVNGKEQGDDEI